MAELDDVVRDVGGDVLGEVGVAGGALVVAVAVHVGRGQLLVLDLAALDAGEEESKGIAGKLSLLLSADAICRYLVLLLVLS